MVAAADKKYKVFQSAADQLKFESLGKWQIDSDPIRIATWVAAALGVVAFLLTLYCIYRINSAFATLTLLAARVDSISARVLTLPYMPTTMMPPTSSPSTYSWEQIIHLLFIATVLLATVYLATNTLYKLWGGCTIGSPVGPKPTPMIILLEITTPYSYVPLQILSLKTPARRIRHANRNLIKAFEIRATCWGCHIILDWDKLTLHLDDDTTFSVVLPHTIKVPFKYRKAIQQMGRDDMSFTLVRTWGDIFVQIPLAN